MNNIKDLLLKYPIAAVSQPKDFTMYGGVIVVESGVARVDFEKLKKVIDLSKFVPFRFKDGGFDEVRWGKISNESKSYIFTGGVGVGKTFTMQAIANAFTLHGFADALLQQSQTANPEDKLPALEYAQPIHTTTSISKLLKEEFNKYDSPKLLNSLVKCNVLFIDDLGIENVTEWWLEQIGYIINERYNWNRPLVLSTNLDIRTGKFSEFYGDRITSRLIQMCEIVAVKGKDRRL